MGFFGSIFGSGKAKKTGPLFTTSLEVEKTLFRLGTLSQEQRVLVKSIILKFMGSGGVTAGEYQSYVIPELYKLMQTGSISSVDYQKLKSLIYK
jgi:hypothetical protein